MGKTKSSKNTIRFKCIKCGGQLRVSQKMAGRYIDCPKCKGRTGVPENQAAADAEGGEYTVKSLAVDVPDECDKCGQPLEDGSVFCIGCGYDYRKGKFQEPVTDVQTENAFVAWVRELNFGRLTSAAVVVALLGGIGFYIFSYMAARRSGGNVSSFMYDSLSQMTTERNVVDSFGTPRERIKVVAEDLGGDTFLRLDDPADAAKATAAGVDVDATKTEGYTMICDVRAAKDTMLMVSKPEMGYFLYYANDTAAMFVLLEEDTTSGSEEVCNYASRIQATGNGSYEVFCDGLGPVIGAGGDFRGYYWTPIFEAGQVLSPDNASADFTFKPQQVWRMLKKAKLRDFRK